MRTDLAKLIKEAQTGNGKAFAAVYSFYAPDLYKFALWYTGNSADAQDCVQEAVLLSFSSIAKLKKPAAFKSWMFKILSNVCKDCLKSNAAKFSTVPIQDVQETVADTSIEDFELNVQLSDALSQLEADERQIVLLSVIGRYKSGEIAQMLSMPAGSVRSKLSRSLSKLRSILK